MPALPATPVSSALRPAVVPAPRLSLESVGAEALLDAIPDAAAVLDSAGVIVAVNVAWRRFAADNGGVPASTGVGVDYLAVCERSAAAGCEDAAVVADGLRAVLGGATVESDLVYPCPSPAVARWFVLRLTPLAGGALVTHVNVSRQKAAELELARKASSDPLTGLANRVLLEEGLRKALSPRPGRAPVPDVGVLMIDLDRFKPVNDRFGHAAGDEVLQLVASRLRDVVRPQDTVARQGGDEFVVVAPRITEEGLAGLVRRLRAALDVEHVVHGVPARVGASIGAVIGRPGEDPAELLRRADELMYREKRRR